MNIILSGYRDGGSISIKIEDDNHYVIDRRIGSKRSEPTNDVWFGYPETDGSRLATEFEICTLYIMLKKYGCDPHGQEYHYEQTMEILDDIINNKTINEVIVNNSPAPIYDSPIIYSPYIPLIMTTHHCSEGGECEFNEDIQLLTYPPQVRCTKCNKTKFKVK
jgi:hypothetical protein